MDFDFNSLQQVIEAKCNTSIKKDKEISKEMITDAKIFIEELTLIRNSSSNV
jgi:hypothetical protein